MSDLLIELLEKFRGRLPPDYIEAIVGLKEGDDDRRFLNDSDVHAQLLILCMIGAAQPDDMIRNL